MNTTVLAEQIAACHDTLAWARGRGAAMGAAVAALAGGAALWAAGPALALIVALVALLPLAWRVLGARRRLGRLAADHPDIFPLAMERFRTVMATHRASRYKLFC